MRITLTVFFALLLLSSVSFAQQIQLPQAGGNYIDPATGHRVYRLTDRTMCPAGAEHVYSDTFEHSRYGTLVQCRYNPSNLNLWTWKLIGPDHSTILFNDIAVASNAPTTSYNYGELQWIPNQQRILGMRRSESRVYEFNPWAGTITVYAQMPAGCVFDWRVNPQGMIVARTNDKSTMCIYDPATGTSATKNMAVLASNPDQTSALFNGRGLYTWSDNPHRAWFPGFTGEIIFDDFHGHLGQFRDQNGQWYTVDAKEDRLANGGVGQIGCPGYSPWRPEQGIYNADTGQRVLIWGCNYTNMDSDHWTTASAVNWFGSSGHTDIAIYNINWTTGGVTRYPIAKVHRDPGTGYQGSPRGTANYELTEILFHSGMCDGNVLEVGGAVKACTGGVAQNLDLYVVETGISAGAPGPDTLPPFMTGGAPSGSLPSGTPQATLSLNTNEAATCKYSQTSGVAYTSMSNTFATTGGTSHSQLITGLSDGNTYNYYVRCIDGNGNTNTNDLIITFTVSNPPVAAAILLNTSLGSNTEVSSPNVGTGTGSSVTGATFTAGQVGNGVLIDAANEYVRYPQIAGGVQNVELDKGTIEFWYRPSYAHSDGQPHYIFATGQWNTPGTVSLIKRGGSNELSAFYFPTGGGFKETNIASNAYSWAANQWVKLRVTWDAGSGTILNVYVDGAQKTGTGDNTGPVAAPAESTTNYIYIGVRNPSETTHAGGIIDELIIASVPLTPSQPWPSPGQQPPPGDTTNPTVSITSPTGGTQSGVITITATASDNVAVAGVQFRVDGNSIGSEDTASPYSAVLNTSTLTNGNHALTAVARDTSNNQATSSSVTINVNNTASPPPFSGLILNGRITRTTSGTPCASCTIDITLAGQTGSATTNSAGDFSIVLTNAVASGNYIADISINDGVMQQQFKRRVTV